MQKPKDEENEDRRIAKQRRRDIKALIGATIEVVWDSARPFLINPLPLILQKEITRVVAKKRRKDYFKNGTFEGRKEGKYFSREANAEFDHYKFKFWDPFHLLVSKSLIFI